MISGRKALNILIHAMAQSVHDLQDRILRGERFKDFAIASRVVGSFETQSLVELRARHDEAVTELRELQAIARKADEEAMTAFVRAMRWRES